VRRFGLLCFNILVAVGGATLYAWVVRRDGMTVESWTRALIEGGVAGFVSGATVGLGATLGPRPALPVKKCLLAHAANAVTSLIGGLIAYYFPRIYSQVNVTIDEALAERGILRGSGIGLAIGTAWNFFQIYFKRRKSSR
jgi:hypothetical protein